MIAATTPTTWYCKIYANNNPNKINFMPHIQKNIRKNFKLEVSFNDSLYLKKMPGTARKIYRPKTIIVSKKNICVIQGISNKFPDNYNINYKTSNLKPTSNSCKNNDILIIL